MCPGESSGSVDLAREGKGAKEKMKRFQIVGLCLVAMFAFSAMVASAAQAASIKACVKVAKVKVEYEKEVPATETKPAKHFVKSKMIPEGLYSDKNCTDRK